MIRIHIILFLLIAINSPLLAQLPEPPVAPKNSYQYIIHGDTITDNYYWLRDKYNTEVVNYLYSENAYADKIMENSATLQKILYEEFKNARSENKSSKPRKLKEYYFYTVNEKGKEYPKLCRKKDSLSAKEEVYLDLNILSEEFTYFTLRINAFSFNQQKLIYGIDDKGNNLSHLYFKDLENNRVTDLKIDSVVALEWFNDNQAFLYIKAEPKTLRSYKVYKHYLFSEKPDSLVYHETDKTLSVSIEKTLSEQYLLLETGNSVSNRLSYTSALSAYNNFTLFKERNEEVRYSFSHFGGNYIYIKTNENAPNTKLLRLNIKNITRPDLAESVIPYNPNKILGNILVLEKFLVYEESEKMNNCIIIKNLETGKNDTINGKINFNSINFSVEDFNYMRTNHLIISEQNLITPNVSYSYSINGKTITIIEKDTLANNYNPDLYITERFLAKSADSTLIPYTLCYKKGLKRDGNNPCLITGYGSYGSSTLPFFNSNLIPLLNRGFVFVQVHIRGGSELGRYWYDEGKMLKKKNTFNDFIACTEDLIKNKFTLPAKIAINGGSAGGLLMGAVSNMRPDLYKCVVADVPFVDVMNTMLDETLPLTVGEFNEWGNPKIKKYYHYMKSYSPYDNVSQKDYPSMLITGGYNDAQVSYWEPAKWCAKLRANKTDSNQLLLKINMDAGHGGSSGRYNAIKEAAFKYAFIMKQLGIKEDYITFRGLVSDINGEPIPYAHVAIEGTNKGTLTNFNGEFELELNLDKNPTLVFQTLGFKTEKIKLSIKTPVQDFIIKLKTEDYQLKPVVIKANAKDPAYEIMRNAINNRKKNLEKSSTFVCDVYIRSTVKLIDLPKKIPAFIKIDMADTVRGIMYLSESVAKYAKQPPSNTKEEMMASKVAGMRKGFSWNRVSDILLNFYEPNIKVNYSERPFVSPLSPLAMGVYKFKYLGGFLADGKMVNKIEVIPRIKGDPLFCGQIYISDDDYQIYSTDLYLTKESGIEFTDTLRIKEEFLKSENGNYLLSKVQYKASIGFMGFRASDVMVASLLNYNLTPSFAKKYFGYEVFKIAKEANKKDTLFWNTSRPILLTAEEEKHYVKQDSISIIKASKEYKDSLDDKRAKLKAGNLLFSDYDFYSRAQKKSIGFGAILKGLSFNTIEGINYKTYFEYRKWSDSARGYNINISPGYGVANKTFYSTVNFGTTLNKDKNYTINISGGRNLKQYNNAEPIGNLVNTGYTLLDERNFLKSYLNDFAKVKIYGNGFPGFDFSTSLSYIERTPIKNNSDFKLIDKPFRDYTSNNPLKPYTDAYAFTKHNLIKFDFNGRFTPKLKYETIGERKRYLPEKQPEFYFSLKAGIGLKDQFNFVQPKIGIGKDFDFGLFGFLKTDIRAGSTFGNNIQFIDFSHFFGNQTIILNPPYSEFSDVRGTRQEINNFHTLPYYSFSTRNSYLEIHTQYNFRGFVIGKIPLIRKTKLYEVAGANLLLSNKQSFYEVYFGLDNIIKAFRVDFASNITNGNFNAFNIRFGFRPGVFF